MDDIDPDRFFLYSPSPCSGGTFHHKYIAEENAMWQTIAIALFLHGVNAALSEGPTTYYAAPAAQQAPRPLAAAVQPMASGKAAAEPMQPVTLQMSVYEAPLTKLRQLGFDGAKVSGGQMTSAEMDKLLAQLGKTGGKGSANLTLSGQGAVGLNIIEETSDTFKIINALRQDRQIKVLAEPTMMTMSGRAASFHAGGAIPVPVPQSDGTVSIEYKKYGTTIDFLPKILDNKKIRLELRADITEVDRKHSVTIAGKTVPGLRSRAVATVCEMKSGQVLVLSGLRERRPVESSAVAADGEKTKEAGVKPSKIKAEETALLLTVKAEIVEPMGAAARPTTAQRPAGMEIRRR
jgi:pilus assembly protein CpaC